MTQSCKSDRCWHSLTLSILGGDEREQEIARLAALTGAKVRAFGFPWPDEGIRGVSQVDNAASACRGADIVLMPIPLPQLNGAIFATEKIIPREGLLSLMNPRAHIITGASDAGMRQAAEVLAIGIHEYEHDQSLMLLRAPAIVEAAIKIIIENTRITIHMASICVVGQGNIGSLLSRSLMALGAIVTVAARNPIQRAAAYAAGAHPVTIDALGDVAGTCDVLLSTVPAPVVTAQIIDRLPPRALVMDLAAPPGGVDLDYAQSTSRPAVWARALGRRAPITVGASQWGGIEKIIVEIFKEQVT